MKSKTERPSSKRLYTAIMTALVLGASVAVSSHALEDVSNTGPSAGGAPETGPILPEDIVLDTDVAMDRDGNAYEEGGPAGLYKAITDKQQKLGMTGVFEEGKLVGVTYEGSNPGHQTALARLRENLERKLNKLDDGTETGPTAEGVPETGQTAGEAPDTGPVLPEDVVLDTDVAMDRDGNAYEEGGPAGLYKAITDKQQKLGMTGVFEEGKLVGVTYEGSNPGHQTALARLRENLERKLDKLDDATDTGPTLGEAPDTGPTAGELAVSAELGISKQSIKAAKARVDKSQKPEKSVKHEKVTRTAKVERVEKISKPVRVERVERPQKPTKITRVERPQRPEKISRVEKPQRPQKPQKPEKPERPGRS